MSDLKEKLQQWDEEANFKLSTDLTILQHDTKTNHVYNSTADTVFIDLDAFDQVDDFYQTLFEKSLEDHTNRIWNNSQGAHKTTAYFPFTFKAYVEHGFETSQQLREFLLANLTDWRSDLTPQSGGVYFSGFLIDVKKTFVDIEPLDAIKWLHHIATGTMFSPLESFKSESAERERDIDIILSSPFYLFLEKVIHRYEDRRIYGLLKEHTLKELFEEKYIAYEGARNSFIDYIYMVHQQAKALYTLVNQCNQSRMIYHHCWALGNRAFQTKTVSIFEANHPLYDTIERFIESPDATNIKKTEKFALRKMYRFSFKSVTEIPHDFFLNVFESIRNSKGYNTNSGLSYKTFQKLFDYLEYDFPREKLSPATLKVLSNANSHRKSPDLNWAEGKISEAIRKAISSWLHENTNNVVAERINHFIDYLILINEKGQNIQQLADLRATIFYDPLELENILTFHSYLDTTKLSVNSKKSVWSSVFDALSWCFNYLSKERKQHIPCPMPSTSSVYGAVRAAKHQTSRRAMPSNFYDVLLDVVTENDYENIKSPQRITVLNQVTGKLDIVEFKNIARMLHLLLLVPLRSHQVRWLDEGLLDDELFDYDAMEYVSNPYAHLLDYRYDDGKSHTEKFGKTGVLRASFEFSDDDADDTDDAIKLVASLVLYINTNKTSKTLARKKGGYGYELPWPAKTGVDNIDKVYEVIKEQIEFNRLYASTPEFTTPVDVADENANKYTKSEWRNLPKHVPLFRDIRQERITNKLKIEKTLSKQPLCLPTSAEGLREAFYKALELADKRFKEIYPAYKNRSVAYDSNGNRIFDVHTLRVYGITSLLERGLSADTVQALVGHATSVMTLYYKKLMAEDYKRKLLAAKTETGVANKNAHHFLSNDGEELIAIFDVASDFDGIDEKHHPRNFSHGMPMILNGGVCYGFNCDDGKITIKISQKGESQVVEANEYQRCGLCRFFKSGPEFLLEQIYYFNLVGTEITNLIEKRTQLIQKSKETYKSKDLEESQIASHQINLKLDDINLELAKLIQERERREQLLKASLEKANMTHKDEPLLPATVGTNVKAEDAKQIMLENDLEKHMEIATQAMILGIDDDEHTISMRELKKLYNKLSDITKTPNALLYVADDNVKRAAILYKIQQVTEVIGRTLTNEEYEDPRILMETLQIDTAEKIKLALNEFNTDPTLAIGGN